MASTTDEFFTQRSGSALMNRKRRMPFYGIFFVISVFVPLSNLVSIGGVLFTPTRLVLGLSFLFLATGWIMGKAGPKNRIDFFVLLFCLWAFIAVTNVHGIGFAVEPSGQLFLDIFGGYLLGRFAVASAAQAKHLAVMMVVISAILLPFTFVEFLTSRLLLTEILQMLPFGDVVHSVMAGQRLGFYRVQGPTIHPIIFGVLSASTMPLFLYLAKEKRKSKAALKSTSLILNTIFSLSTGAYVTVAVQFILMLWDRFTTNIKKRWHKFFGGALFSYIAIDLLSDRTPITVFISFATFNSASSYNRVLIWKFGMENVYANPIFGIGFNDWERVYWMISSSVDNFWLLMTMRYGIPGFLLLASALAFHIYGIARRKFDPHSPEGRSQKAFLISYVSLLVAMCTVHVWHNMLPFFFFLVGAGSWLITARPDGAPSPGPAKGFERPTAIN